MRSGPRGRAAIRPPSTRSANAGRRAATPAACERALRPAVVQRKVSGGRAMGLAKGEAELRIVVATAALRTTATPFATLLATITA
ncbi:hypothetical protein [Methylobacterium aquaticum]|uniref:hypothetical protein n=1 Tax=Methylobacterium aquaticum TaxID=270351 RepID=UPI0019317303|nr:hypothetical protein F1D61_03510 [Methylobacterium aquaticum]